MAANGLSERALYRVQQMAFGRGEGKAKGRSRIIYNNHLTLSGIPEEAYCFAMLMLFA